LEQRLKDELAKLREDLDQAVEELGDAAASSGDPPAIDPAYVNRWIETAKRPSVQISNDLPPQLDPEAVAEIRKIIINLLDGLEHVDPARPLDAIDQFAVQLEAVRHIIRDALDEHVGCRDDDARPLIAYLKDALPRVTQADQARIAGMSTRHFQRLGTQGGMPPRQLVLAGRLVKLLRYTWNPEGAVAWFYRERKELDGHAPIDLANNPGFEQTLLRLAREGRALHAA
jgi:AraC-like DNA-binding protein